MLADLLMRRFKIDADGAEELIGAARDADNEAVDLYGFTSLLKRRLDQAEREKLVEMMWKLVFVDGKVHEFEDNLVWRVAELLGVSSQARIRLEAGRARRLARLSRATSRRPQTTMPSAMLQAASNSAAEAKGMKRPILIVLHQEHSTPGRVGLRLIARGFPLDMRRPRFGEALPSSARWPCRRDHLRRSDERQ